MDKVATSTCLHMREVGSAWRSARGQSGHACTVAPAACCAVSAQHTVQAKWWWAATAECYPINRLGGKFPGSAQMLTQARSFRPPPMAEVATRTCLYMLVLEGSAHGRSRHLQMPLHARS